MNPSGSRRADCGAIVILAAVAELQCSSEKSVTSSHKPKSADAFDGDALPLADPPKTASNPLSSANPMAMSARVTRSCRVEEMSQTVWISGMVILAAVLVGTGLRHEVKSGAEQVSYVELPAASSSDEASRLEDGTIGSALATAAFGLSALQPETFNSEIVLDIIDASPLGYAEKDRLTARLMAAKAGRAELPSVLADIRSSLAIE